MSKFTWLKKVGIVACALVLYTSAAGFWERLNQTPDGFGCSMSPLYSPAVRLGESIRTRGLRFGCLDSLYLDETWNLSVTLGSIIVCASLLFGLTRKQIRLIPRVSTRSLLGVVAIVSVAFTSWQPTCSTWTNWFHNLQKYQWYCSESALYVKDFELLLTDHTGVRDPDLYPFARATCDTSLALRDAYFLALWVPWTNVNAAEIHGPYWRAAEIAYERRVAAKAKSQ